ARDPSAPALELVDGGRVDLDRFRRLEPALESVEAGNEEASDGQVGVAARVGGLELGVRRGLLEPTERGRDAHGRLPVVVAPTTERAGPRLRHDPMIGVEARGGEAAEPRQVLEDAGDEGACLLREAVSGAGVVEAVVALVPEREVDVAAVSGHVRPRLR